MAVKISALAPTPSARVMTMIAVNVGAAGEHADGVADITVQVAEHGEPCGMVAGVSRSARCQRSTIRPGSDRLAVSRSCVSCARSSGSAPSARATASSCGMP